jgi:glucose-1-phosphate thymidylyltransferase
MKGIILAGGTGSRLHPLTKATNKHLLPIGSFPMIHYPITSLTNAGIRDIMVITGTEHMGDMVTFLGSGKEYDCEFTFRVQDQPDGIAGALKLCENFVGHDSCVTILGDNIFKYDLSSDLKDFKNGCKLFFIEVEDPERYGVGVFEEGELVAVEEKPKKPKSNLACVGIYVYDNSVFKVINNTKKSLRGEYEISSVNNAYIEKGIADFSILDGGWVDAGTMDAYHRTNRIIYDE